MATIVPALLSSKKEKIQEMVDICSEFADLIQIDIMDGKFVPSKSITKKELIELDIKLAHEIHLMVENPLEWIEPARAINTKRVIFHFEAVPEPIKIISAIKKAGREVGICLNPETKIKKLSPIIEEVDLVLFMSVNPGFYGAPFIPEVLSKIINFKSKWPEKKAAIDGGIKEENIITVKNTGLDYICVGSAILKAKDPRHAFNNFKSLISDD